MWYNNHVKEITKQLQDRKSLIATIARRHASERELFESTQVEKNTTVQDEYQAQVQDEFERVCKSSTFNPISL